jgi:AraC-like DNA-binding protein
MTTETVAASYARAFMDFAVSKGADRAHMIERSALAPGDLLDPDNRVPLERYKALVRAARESSGVAAIALHFGESALFFERSILGLIIRSADTLGEAFVQMNRYGPVVNDVEFSGSEGRFVVVRKKGAIWLEDRRRNAADFPEITESTIARLVCEYERCFPERPPVARSVHVTHKEPDYRAEYDRILKAPITFDAEWNALAIDEAWLTARIPTANPYVFGIFSAHAEALLKELKESETVRGKVESLLIPVLHKGDLGMERLARQMGVSRPTLYRQLKAEGVSFETLVDELRHKMALHYLSGGKATVNETAYLVGFADPASFSRAFKRWTGSRPSAAKPPKS